MFEGLLRSKPHHDRPKETGSARPETIADTEFERQFNDIEYVDVGGVDAKIIDVAPENLSDETPILLAPGYLSKPKEYREAMRNLYLKGRRVISVTHPRYGGFTELSPEQEKLIGKCPSEEIRKALTLLAVLNKKDITDVDVFAHSGGAVNSAIAALLDPEKVRNIAFCSPAGMVVEKDRKEIPRGMRKHIIGSRTISGGMLAQAIKNPVRAFEEGRGLTEADIHTVLEKLHENGIGLLVVSRADDPVFPADKTAEFLKGMGTEKNQIIDGFLSIAGGHGHLEEYVDLIEPYFAQLERNKEKKRVTASL